MEQLIVLIIAGVIALANYLVKKSREDAGGDNDTPPSFRRQTVQRRPVVQEESEEERMRKFMEALGVPSASQPPRTIERPAPPQQSVPPAHPPVQPMRPVTHAPVTSIRLRRPVVHVAPPLPVVQSKPAPEPVIAVAQPPPAEPETTFPEVASTPSEPLPIPALPTAITLEAPAESVDPLGIRAMLRNPASLRAAMVLREVMGPPRSLQPFR